MPGKIKPGTECGEIICLTDFMSTCAAILGDRLPDDAAEDSFDILPLFLSDETSQPVRESVVHHSIKGMFSIRKGSWKFIDGRGSGGWSGDSQDDPAPGQLYNMIDDPDESENLYELHPGIVSEMKELLEQIKQEGRSRR